MQYRMPQDIVMDLSLHILIQILICASGIGEFGPAGTPWRRQLVGAEERISRSTVVEGAIHVKETISPECLRS
jgi:hypothetical protein